MSQKDKDIDKTAADKPESSEAADSAEKTEASEAAEQSEDTEKSEDTDKADDVEGASESEPEAESDAEATAEESAADETAESADDGDDDAGSEPGDEGEVGELYGLLAEFNSPGELIAAAEKVRDAGFTKWDCYSPFPVHGIDPAMGIKRTRLPWFIFVCGLCGLGGGLLLQWWTNAFNWPWIVSGKPFFSIPANIPVTFETTILASAFASFLGMWIFNKLPQVWHPLFRQERFLKVTDDGFFIGIEADDGKFQRGKTEKLLGDAGASAVEACYLDPDPERRQIPRVVIAFIIASTCLALVPLALIVKAHHTRSDKPHLHIFPDMDFQEKFNPQTKTSLFADHRSVRSQVAGTVARGELRTDTHFYEGTIAGQWATTFPARFEVSERTMARGKERFEIFCSPCHGASGRGDGLVNKRAQELGSASTNAWTPPTDLSHSGVVQAPHGQIYATITHGLRAMPSYKAQISEKDRWAIVLYLRALQRSQNANITDVPPDLRNQIQ